MRFAHAAIVTAVMAAVSYAKPSEYDTMCFHCIKNGYAFCKTGTGSDVVTRCVDATCANDTL